MKPQIALVGMACRYPDARSPQELWHNVLAQRRAFRRLPPGRLCQQDYVSRDRAAADKTYAAIGAVIEGYEFDRARFRVAGSTYRSADLAHWLALEVAADALADAGFPEAEELSREATGVLLGNTLTGEFSRAGLMRLRWPYVRRVVDAALANQDWTTRQRGSFLSKLESQYKAPFPPVGEETLAGGLSNTIAGRICNHFNLHGGGFTVDGACASSLLAIAQACSALVAGDLDVALAGGVDLSLDPFELVGFAKTGALAADQMRVYDERSAGFWPGEGCGMLVLMRYQDAVTQGKRVYAVIRGWGISSDGSGGITRPEVEGQLLALERAYQRAGYPIDSVSYIEGHGTGTAVGDTTELRTLSRAIRQAAADRCLEPIAIGSIKANIGHTKAAAGVAGVIKATMALHEQLLPPTTGCEKPHSELTCAKPMLRVLGEAASWPQGRPRRAAVSAMGFGGINAHITLAGIAKEQARRSDPKPIDVVRSAQDTELFLFEDADANSLAGQIEHVAGIAGDLSWSELGDLSAQLARSLRGGGVRAAVVAASPAQLASRLELLGSRLSSGILVRVDARNGVFLGHGSAETRIGFLFPGQASPTYLDGGALARRFSLVKDLYERVDLPAEADRKATQLAQPAIAVASCAGLRMLEHLGIRACVGIGHSVGELAALHWAGVLDESALIRVASMRGRVMARWGQPGGAMAGIGGGQRRVKSLLNGESVAIAGLNSPRQTVVSGAAGGVQAVVERAKAEGLSAAVLPVSHAFHSSFMQAAASVLKEQLDGERFGTPQGKVVSTITGSALTAGADLSALLVGQLTAPVRFVEAIAEADPLVDLWIEAGPGRVLAALLEDQIDTPVVALDASGPSLQGLLQAVGAAFALGASVDHGALWAGRFTRRFNLDWQPRFFINPCELAPLGDRDEVEPTIDTGAVEPSTEIECRESAACSNEAPTTTDSPLQVMRELVAQHLELPIETVCQDSHLLTDLHLNSIAVGQLVGQAVRRLNLAPLESPTEYASVTVGDVAQALTQLREIGHQPSEKATEDRPPKGVDSWVRSYTVPWVVCPPPENRPPPAGGGLWQVIAPPDHALAHKLQKAFAQLDWGCGVVVAVGPEPDRRAVAALLEGARKVLARKDGGGFVVVHDGGGAAGFAKTLHLEAPHVSVCSVQVPVDHPDAVEWVIREARGAGGFTEVRYDRSGVRTRPVLRLLSPQPQPDGLPIDGNDCLLVTGGGKGIAAECALDLARHTGVRLVLLGRSKPGSDRELEANLRRMADTGAQVMYCSADVTDAAEVRSAISTAQARFGPVTAVMHGAGVNVPQLIASLDEAACCRTLAPKIIGLRNVLAAVDPTQLRLLVTFSSIIGRIGLPGEADYALANDWLSCLTERFGLDYPRCRCLALEWSVWSGVGMGQRLGRIELLEREGITPISPDQGVAVLRELIGQRAARGRLVVTGRFNKPPTVEFERAGLPAVRFLETPRVHYPGVELVVDVSLSLQSDPYLKDHTYQKQHLFPAVMGLEAMTQVMMALAAVEDLPVLEEAQFDRPVVVPAQGVRKIRLAALRSTTGRVQVVLQSEETGFQTSHFRATFQAADRCDPARVPQGVREGLAASGTAWSKLDHDLYGPLLFHTGRFQRLRRYHRLRATECWAEITTTDQTDWFGGDLPGELKLGDPGVRDAAIHAIQACIPHARLLPIAVERISLARLDSATPVSVYAQQRYREGDLFVYDMCLVGSDGGVLECWQGLQLKRVEALKTDQPWVVPLLGPYVERSVGERIPQSDVSVAILNGQGPGTVSPSDLAIQQAVGRPVSVCRRPDGKPEVNCGKNVSLANASGLTIAVAATENVGCDLEPVVDRSPQAWRDLLGAERMDLVEQIRRENPEGLSNAATRVWAAVECLKKAGQAVSTPLSSVSENGDGWLTLRAGAMAIATCVADVRAVDDPVVLAVLVGVGSQGGTSKRAYRHRHVVSFEETNAVGNVYYTNFLLWQGQCREMFLRENAKGVLQEIKSGLALVTTRCQCEYFAELWAFDELEIRMYLDRMEQNLIDLSFEYWRIQGGEEQLVARGQQQVACTLPDGTRAIPDTIRNALQEYAS